MAKSEGGAARSRITVDLPEATGRRLRTIAARRHLTLQEYVRHAVERQLAEDAPSDLRAEDAAVLGKLWSNDADAVYDEVADALRARGMGRIKNVALRDLRNHAATVLRRVEGEEHLRVTVKGRPVAEMRPLARRREAVPWRDVSRALETCRSDTRLLDDLRAAVPDTTNDLG